MVHNKQKCLVRGQCVAEAAAAAAMGQGLGPKPDGSPCEDRAARGTAADGEGAGVCGPVKGQSSGFEPHWLPREQRAALGAAAKRLIDAGRLAFLRTHGFQNVCAVQYVPPQVSGENWLLVASTDPVERTTG